MYVDRRISQSSRPINSQHFIIPPHPYFNHSTSLFIQAPYSSLYFHIQITQQNMEISSVIDPVYPNGIPLKINQFVLADLLRTPQSVFSQNLEKQGILFNINQKSIRFKKTLTYRSEKVESPCTLEQQYWIDFTLKKWEKGLETIVSLLEAMMAFDSKRRLKQIRHYKNKTLNKKQAAKNFLKGIHLQIQTLFEIQPAISKFIESRNLSKQKQIIFNAPEALYEPQFWANATNEVSAQHIFIINQNLIVENTTPVCSSGVSQVQIVRVNRLEIQDGNKLGLTQLIKKSQKKTNSSERERNIEYRFKRELQIIEHLQKFGKKSYLCNYYITPLKNGQDKNYYFLNKIDCTLAEYLNAHHSELGYLQLLSISIQLVDNLIDLHKCGVVHRDIKPNNIMVSQEGPTINLKIIDYSQSVIIGDGRKHRGDEFLCGTIPYSPIETDKSCKGPRGYEQCGLDKIQIDFWSVGILLSYIFYRKTGVSFCRNFWKQISILWQTQFECSFKVTKSQNIINRIISWLCFHLVQVRQQNRIKLEEVRTILKSLFTNYEKLIKFQ